MPSLIIYTGQSIHFWIRTGAGTINDGGSIPDNIEYLPGKRCEVIYPEYDQVYDCSDTVTVQIRWDNTETLVYHVVDQSDDSVDAFGIPSSVAGDYYEFTLDWSTFTCGSCYKIHLYTLSLQGSIWTLGDSGTFETGSPATWGLDTGLGNTLAQDAVTFRSGANSASITAPGVPGAGMAEIISPTSSQTLTTNTWYVLTAYINDNATNPFVSSTEECYWAIQSGFGDTTIMTETKYTEGDGLGTWHKVEVIFRTGATTTGIWELRTTSTPQANGVINVDDITLKGAGPIEEAVSNSVHIGNVDGDACYLHVKYNNDNNGEIEYETSGMEHHFRMVGILGIPRYVDPDYTTSKDTAGDTSVVNSNVEKIIPVRIGFAPAYMHEKWARASKSDNFRINDAYYAASDNDYTPDEPEDRVQATTGTIEVVPRSFRMTNRNC